MPKTYSLSARYKDVNVQEDHHKRVQHADEGWSPPSSYVESLRSISNNLSGFWIYMLPVVFFMVISELMYIVPRVMVLRQRPGESGSGFGFGFGGILGRDELRPLFDVAPKIRGIKESVDVGGLNGAVELFIARKQNLPKGSADEADTSHGNAVLNWAAIGKRRVTQSGFVSQDDDGIMGGLLGENTNRLPRKGEFVSGDSLEASSEFTLKEGDTVLFCRIYQTCILADGSILLPKWMEKYDDLLVRKCGFFQRVYAIDVDDEKSRVTSRYFRLTRGGDYSKVDYAPIRDLDTDVLSVMRDWFPYVLLMLAVEPWKEKAETSNIPSYKNSTPYDPPFERHCAFSPGPDRCPDMQKVFPSITFIAHKELSLPIYGTTNYMLLERLIRGRAEFRVADMEKLFPSIEEENAVCFRSTIVSPLDFYATATNKGVRKKRVSKISMELGAEESYSPGFEVPNVIRSMLTSTLPKEWWELAVQSGNAVQFAIDSWNTVASPWSETSSSSAGRTVTAVILAQRGERSFKLDDRDLAKSFQIKMDETQEVQQGKLKAVVYVHRLEELNLEQQLHLMDGTQVLITAFGPSILGLLFLRKGSLLIEVVPFASPPSRLLSHLALTHSLKLLSFPSKPDVPTFKRCLLLANGGLNPISRDALAAYDKAVNEFRADENHEDVSIIDLSQHKVVSSFSECLYIQKLDIDPTSMATAIVIFGDMLGEKKS